MKNAKKTVKKRAAKRKEAKRSGQQDALPANSPEYDVMLDDLVRLFESARRTSARAVNSVMTATYWLVGRRIVDFEQGGQARAAYGAELLARLSADLTRQFGRGFSAVNLTQMRRFYQLWPASQILQTPSEEFGTRDDPTGPAELPRIAGLLVAGPVPQFPLPWSHYVRLMRLENDARAFYEQEALQGGWSVRQLDRQIDSRFYERTMMSRNKAAMLRRGRSPRPADETTAEEEIKDPFVLEFLDLKDEYSESDLEQALVASLETFLLELGGQFAFLGRQRRLRIGDQWYRVDLLFFHRRLRCLVIIDLKLGKFTHADAGQMHLYLNYAREHWMEEGENPPVGLILCAERDAAVAHYALEGLPNKVLASEYRLQLPDEAMLAAELEHTRRLLEHRPGGLS